MAATRRGPRKPLHPLVQQALMVGLGVGARAVAKAFDSLLKDAAVGLGAAEERVQKVRRNVHRKVQESMPPYDDDAPIGRDEEE